MNVADECMDLSDATDLNLTTHTCKYDDIDLGGERCSVAATATLGRPTWRAHQYKHLWGQLPGQLLHGSFTTFNEPFPQQQITRGIAADGQFRSDEEINALISSGRVENGLGIDLKSTDS